MFGSVLHARLSPRRGPVRMRIENIAGRHHVPKRNMPRLEGSDTDGYMEAVRTTTGLFLFKESWLEQGVGSDEGEYR